MGPATNIGTQLAEIGTQLQWHRQGLVAEAGMCDVPVLEQRAREVGDAVQAVLHRFNRFVGVELIDYLQSWPTGAKAYTLKSKIVAIEYILGKDKANWKNAFAQPVYTNGPNATEIFTPPSDPDHVCETQDQVFGTFGRQQDCHAR